MRQRLVSGVEPDGAVLERVKAVLLAQYPLFQWLGGPMPAHERLYSLEWLCRRHAQLFPSLIHRGLERVVDCRMRPAVLAAARALFAVFDLSPAHDAEVADHCRRAAGAAVRPD